MFFRLHVAAAGGALLILGLGLARRSGSSLKRPAAMWSSWAAGIQLIVGGVAVMGIGLAILNSLAIRNAFTAILRSEHFQSISGSGWLPSSMNCATNSRACGC